MEPTKYAVAVVAAAVLALPSTALAGEAEPEPGTPTQVSAEAAGPICMPNEPCEDTGGRFTFTVAHSAPGEYQLRLCTYTGQGCKAGPIDFSEPIELLVWTYANMEVPERAGWDHVRSGNLDLEWGEGMGVIEVQYRRWPYYPWTTHYLYPGDPPYLENVGESVYVP